MNFKFFSKNGQLLPIDQAVISVFNLEYAYGFGVYENIRVKNKRAYFLDDHIDRLFISAEVIGLSHSLTKQFLHRAVSELLTATIESTYNLKILLIGAKESGAELVFILPLAPLFPDRQLYKKGASSLTVRYERFLPSAKTLNMLPSYLYYTRAKQKGYIDALFVDGENNILEGSRTNFFAIKNNTIYTAPEEKILPGVTRKYVLKVALANGFKIEEKFVSVSNLANYDGAFLTSTSSKIVPLKSINDFSFRDIDPNIKKLIKLFDEYLDEYSLKII